MKAALLLLSLSVYGADLYTGEQAAQAGDFKTAIAELRPLAEAGVDEVQVWLGTGGRRSTPAACATSE
ncbi:MAG TPA: hypothetical protein VMT15_20150 [Bryobacteraceae bacterium]|nr:hypothetical protein [Bryobacteraceae bacterium]